MVKNKKRICQKEKVFNSKNPTYVELPENFYAKSPVWSFKKLDIEHPQWGKANSEEILPALKSFEGLTWGELIKASGGKTYGTNNHFISIKYLIKEAQKRWEDLKLEEYDQVFSLRMGGSTRLYGILEEGIFKMVWFDTNHEICPCKKKHT